MEGQKVNILVDGAVHPNTTVVNGAVTLQLDELPTTVHIGLPLIGDLELLPPAIESDPAFGQASVKNATAVYLRVVESSIIKAGPDADHLREYPQRTNEPYGTPPRPVNAPIKIVIDGKWSQDSPVLIRQDKPLALTIASATTEIAMGG